MTLPLYQCHKKVRAAKIEIMLPPDNDGNRTLFLNGNVSVTVDAAWLTRNPKVEVGGYFVEYQEGDGYTAYSPAFPFENGYTRIEE